MNKQSTLVLDSLPKIAAGRPLAVISKSNKFMNIKIVHRDTCNPRGMTIHTTLSRVLLPTRWQKVNPVG
jgi:hypothetical protein